MLRIDGDDLRAAALRLAHDQLARTDERLLVRQRDALATFDGGQRRPQADHAGYRSHDGIGGVEHGCGQQPLHSACYLDIHIRKTAL